MKIECKECGQKIELTGHTVVGQKFNCPSCNTLLTISNNHIVKNTYYNAPCLCCNKTQTDKVTLDSNYNICENVLGAGAFCSECLTEDMSEALNTIYLRDWDKEGLDDGIFTNYLSSKLHLDINKLVTLAKYYFDK